MLLQYSLSQFQFPAAIEKPLIWFLFVVLIFTRCYINEILQLKKLYVCIYISIFNIEVTNTFLSHITFSQEKA